MSDNISAPDGRAANGLPGSQAECKRVGKPAPLVRNLRERREPNIVDNRIALATYQP
jgi:hypothetical protein